MRARLDLRGPQQLYRQWEHEQWNPFEIDLAADRAQWDALLRRGERVRNRGQQPGADFEGLGATSEEIRDFALTGLRRRLNVIGVPLETL